MLIRALYAEGFLKTLQRPQVTRGIPKLLKYAKKHGDQIFENNLTSFTRKDSEPSQKYVLVHENCRNPHRNTKCVHAEILTIPQTTTETSPKKSKLRLSQPVKANSVNHCFNRN